MMKKVKFRFLLQNLAIISILIFSACDEEATSGCMESDACNFDANATESDNSCTYPQPNFDCDGNCTLELDCALNCGGSLIEDCNGECGGTAVVDCNDDCGGTAILDCNDECDGTATLDCNNECGGNAIIDECGVCGGDGPNANGCCEDDIVGCTGQCGDESYVDCNGDCCEPLVYNDCLDILANDSQSAFCEQNFSDNSTLLGECNGLAVTTLDAFCELQFGCASIDCSGECTGGNTGLPNYEICDCFEPEALNYWCNDGGQCPPPGGTSVPSSDLLDCQDECIVATTGSYIAINPDIYDNGVLVYNDSDMCCFSGCTDNNASNYDSNCTEDSGTCQYDNYLKIGEITESTIEILIHSTENIGGFQFSFEGLELTGSDSGSGGLADSNGFTVSTGVNGVLGLSFTGTTIPPTTEESVLTIINYSNLADESICIPSSSLILSDPTGAEEINGYVVHYESACP